MDHIMDDDESASAEVMLWKVLHVLGDVSEQNLAKRPGTAGATFSCQVSRRQLLELKAEVDRQYPGIYEYMRRLQKDEGT